MTRTLHAARAADWRALGVAVRLVVTDPAVLLAARTLLDSELRVIDAACSRFRPAAEIARFDTAGGRPVRVSPVLLEAIQAALRAARLTDGLVDPALGRALVAAGYDRDFAELRDDGPAVPVRPIGPDWRGIEVDEARGTVAVPAGMRLDLGATAKALAADRAACAIIEHCGVGVLVGLGGDLAAAGPPPTGGWRVRVTDVTDAPDGPGTVVAIRAGGLATSGTAARRWCRGGRWLHHIIDPLTGVPADSPWRTVSVTAASCLDANIASTAAVVLGWAAPQWLAERGLAARLVAEDGAVHRCGGWPADGAA